MVKSSTLSQAGMPLLPLIVTSIVSGRLISRIGRYRLFPIPGTLLTFMAMVLPGTLTIDTPVDTFYFYIALSGFGPGMVMQVLILAVQNGVELKQIGVAAFGTLFTARLRTQLETRIPEGIRLPHQPDVKAIHQLPALMKNEPLRKR